MPLPNEKQNAAKNKKAIIQYQGDGKATRSSVKKFNEDSSIDTINVKKRVSNDFSNSGKMKRKIGGKISRQAKKEIEESHEGSISDEVYITKVMDGSSPSGLNALVTRAGGIPRLMALLTKGLAQENAEKSLTNQIQCNNLNPHDENEKSLEDNDNGAENEYESVYSGPSSPAPDNDATGPVYQDISAQGSSSPGLRIYKQPSSSQSSAERL
ncbi:hypothetical protein BJV82DRAFT_676019 [Fennellomyces sp. T-0311]|nr:hypothetical protein BJV82DRAFT_676019 [Fennellomyces sp. T-0311]